MRTKLLAFFMLCTAPLWGDSLLYPFRLSAELQTPGPESLSELTWQQGTTPMIEVEVLQRGRPVAADADTAVRMIIGPSATSDYFAVVTNTVATNTSYYIQWPTVGTNTAGAAWWYTIYFEKDGHRYWTGNGDLYIKATTSTDPDGIVWQEIITPHVSWGDVLGDIDDQADLQSALGDKVDVGADGTSTNLSDYHNDAGFITAVWAVPVSSVFGRTGDVVAVESDYAAYFATTGTVADIDARVTVNEGDISYLQDAIITNVYSETGADNDAELIGQEVKVTFKPSDAVYSYEVIDTASRQVRVMASTTNVTAERAGTTITLTVPSGTTLYGVSGRWDAPNLGSSFTLVHGMGSDITDQIAPVFNAYREDNGWRIAAANLQLDMVNFDRYTVAGMETATICKFAITFPAQ